MPHFYCCAALIPCMTGPWLGCQKCPLMLKTSCLCSCHAEITIIHVEGFLHLHFSWKWDELINISRGKLRWVGTIKWSRGLHLLSRMKNGTFSKELIMPERIQWLFTHQGIVRCSAGCCQRSGEGEFPIAPQEKICQHVKTIRGCVMTGSADNSLSTRILFQWRSLWPDETPDRQIHVQCWPVPTCSSWHRPSMDRRMSKSLLLALKFKVPFISFRWDSQGGSECTLWHIPKMSRMSWLKTLMNPVRGRTQVQTFKWCIRTFECCCFLTHPQ